MKYTNKQIIDGLECWLNQDSDIDCENCAFYKESKGQGKCKGAVLREAIKILEGEKQ